MSDRSHDAKAVSSDSRRRFNMSATPATPPAEPMYSHEETERLLNAFGAWACGNLADGSSAHWNIRQVAAQLARADERVTWCEKELSEMRLLVNGYFSTADALTKTEDERDRLRRENEELRKLIARSAEGKQT